MKKLLQFLPRLKHVGFLATIFVTYNGGCGSGRPSSYGGC